MTNDFDFAAFIIVAFMLTFGLGIIAICIVSKIQSKLMGPVDNTVAYEEDDQW